MHLSLLKPHPPLIAPHPYNTLYPLDAVSLPQHRAPTAAAEAESHPYLAATVGAEMGEEQLREMRSSYYGLITECDDNLGRVFEALERSGQHDNTVIVFTTVLIPHHLIDAWRRGLPGLSDAGVVMAGSRGAAGGPPPLRDVPPPSLLQTTPLRPAAATTS